MKHTGRCQSARCRPRECAHNIQRMIERLGTLSATISRNVATPNAAKAASEESHAKLPFNCTPNISKRAAIAKMSNGKNVFKPLDAARPKTEQANRKKSRCVHR